VHARARPSSVDLDALKDVLAPLCVALLSARIFPFVPFSWLSKISD
jgi:hypothetical protein